MTTLKQYIGKEIKVLTDFCELLQKDDIKFKLPEKINEAVSQYLKVINGINYIKFSYVVYKNTNKLKEPILRHKDDIFIQSRPLIPSIDLTEVYFVVKETEFVGLFWDYLAQLTILSALITEGFEKNKKLLEEEKKIDNMKVESNVSLSSMVDSINTEYEDSALLKFVNEIDTENSNITDILMQAVKKMDIGGAIDELTDDNMKEINGVVQDFFGDDKTDFSFIIKDIAHSLKNNDITQGDVGENIQNLAKDMTEKLINTRDQNELKNMAMNSQGIMKNYNPNKDMMSNVEAIMKNQFGKNINKSSIQEAMKSIGMNDIMSLGGISNRKVQRMAKKQMVKANNNPNTRNAKVNNRQAALKAKYQAKKEEKQKQNNQQNQQNQSNQKQTNQQKQNNQKQTSQKK